MSRCRSCNAEIAWSVTARGKKCPVDVDSLTEEDSELLSRGEELRFRFGDHVSHFSTCPDADKFRRPA